MKMLATSRGWRRQFSHPEMQRPPASISGCNGSIRDVVDIFGCLRHPKMHEAIQDARSNSGCARILNCFMHLGMLEAISIKMEIVSGNLRCRSISNCGFPAPDDTPKMHRSLYSCGFRRSASGVYSYTYEDTRVPGRSKPCMGSKSGVSSYEDTRVPEVEAVYLHGPRTLRRYTSKIHFEDNTA